MIDKENIISKLEKAKDSVKDPNLKKEIESKIDKLSNNKPVEK